MSDERLSLAIDRLQRAFERVAAAGAALEGAAAEQRDAGEATRADLARLEQRHHRLRDSAAGAIDQLDGLIAHAGGDDGDG